MQERGITRATLGRLPMYLRYLQSLPAEQKTISAAAISRELGLGEVQVRKDLSSVSSDGRPKIGYVTKDLTDQLKKYLGQNHPRQAVIVGAGKLGRALLDYDGFSDFGIEIAAAFDAKLEKEEHSASGKPIYPLEELAAFCYRSDIRIGIITVPQSAAQEVCDRMVKCNLTALWNFSPCVLKVPPHVRVHQENLALSLAYLVK